jgi:RimJ/RimL family protein N-acetyltransferase
MRNALWRRQVTLTGRQVSLRTARPSDQGTLERLRADAEIDHFMGVDPNGGALFWRQVYLGDQSGALVDLVILGNGETPIGLVSLWDRTIPHKGAELSIWIGATRRNEGNGTEAIRLALRYAFDELSLHKIYLRVLEYNARAIRAYQKCGFQIEGRLRQEMKVEGQWHDLIYMGVLADEFAQADRRLEETKSLNEDSR